ncbi:MAG: endonuclease/exonuclease/phosphatase family protein [Planctomycetaceae bacterium]|jgi:endonuclease/exonuclease/phosphatase family metal-dependent hydrolase|nr:endonuclease/exonuclease/phosphatase family protein [Planctomycetaceae bacterium]MBT6155567.1 endonuclease/exonuclease/phosphatase family protein [Planctomycetaceae bacterium]MBT6485832.1 endonuclease/exonuclease/phosphatase family protein [Planctomycetaceae bacterium]MBT6493501.1 endonuclease/exonuclease/phosphatase family protein [Planctomycetaceae bacterium]
MRWAFFALLICWTSSLNAGETVTIATLNCQFLSPKTVHVKFGLPFDRRSWTEVQRRTWAADGFREQHYRKAVKAIAATIQRIDADVIVLTEVARVSRVNGIYASPNDVTVLHDELKENYPHLAFADSSDKITNQNVAILSRRPFVEGSMLPRIPGREGFFGELDDVESEDETTVSKGMRAAIRIDGDVVYLYPVHLKSERGGHESDAKRIAQASIVRRNYLKQLADDQHVIVIGDLNGHRGQPALRRIRGLDDLNEDLAQTGGPRFFKRRESEPSDEFNRRIRQHWTFEFEGRRTQIDHILISQSIRNRCTQRNYHKKMQIEFIEVTETIEGTDIPATDHRAVKLTLQFLDKHL